MEDVKINQNQETNENEYENGVLHGGY